MKGLVLDVSPAILRASTKVMMMPFTVAKMRRGADLRRLEICIIFTVVAIFCIGCAPTTRFVLLPDPDGKVGQIEVSTSVGSQKLDKPWESTEVVSPDRIPSRTKIMDEKEVRAIFKDALEAQPQLPAVFILYFKSGRTELTNQSLQLMPEILEAIKLQQSNYVSVIGHTDSVAPIQYNRRLSLQRAKSVADILVSGGVDRAIIEIESYGKEKLLIDTPDGVAEPRNRRVEITIR
jgi:outer membrane protein OmpA-like peptidoglycan-associated protein